MIVLSVLFSGLAFAIIYSQVHLHGMREEQALRDTESNLHYVSEVVRQYHREHGKIEDTLTGMELPIDALETRNAQIDDSVRMENGVCVISAKLFKYGEPTCTLTFALDNDAQDFDWSD